MIQRALSIAILGCAVLALVAPSAAAQADHVHGSDPAGHTHAPGVAETVPRAAPWDGEVLDLAATLPVQDGGRVKPLGTLAGFKLLRMNGKRRVTTPDEERLDPVAWMLDCLFFPASARSYEMFLVQDSQVLTAVGVNLGDKKKRDRYTYEELLPGRDALFEQARSLAHKEAKDQTSVERQLLALATNLRDFEQLIHTLDYARHDYAVGGSQGLRAIWDGTENASLSTVLEKAEALRFLIGSLPDDGGEAGEADRTAAFDLLRQMDFFVLQGDGGLALVAPDEHPDHPGHDAHADDEPVWTTVTDLVPVAFQRPGRDAELALLRRFETLEESKGDPDAFRGELALLHEDLRARAEVHGEYGNIPLEVGFYKGDYFYRSLYAFLLGFLLVAFSWLHPRSAWLQRGIWGTLMLGTGLLTTGIVLRCIIRSRPPVSTLYETILFTTGVVVIVAMAIEYINRQRIALAVGTVLGALGMFLSTKYELKEAATAGDTMPSLVAVLDTNFWLATHVTTVTMGYAAGLLAAAIAHLWIFGKMFGVRRGDAAFYKHLARMVYGVLCFGLLFSIIGTVLGGIWANYSWGRFWGWDPKENGALLIVLWELLILHARMGGYIRDHGLCVLAVLGGLVVAFSWWGVNLLGIGLHSYGFTSGVFLSLFVLYVIELGVVLASGAWRLGQRPKSGGLA